MREDSTFGLGDENLAKPHAASITDRTGIPLLTGEKRAPPLQKPPLQIEIFCKSIVWMRIG